MTTTAKKLPSLPLADWQVRACQEGRLTQVRAPMKPQPERRSEDGVYRWRDGDWYEHDLIQRNPLGPVGSVVAVKETWCPRSNGLLMMEQVQRQFYRADGDDSPRRRKPPSWPWRSSQSMPLWASRLSLTLTAVRVEQVQSISEEDAKACCLEGSHLGFDMQFPGSWSRNDWCWVYSFAPLAGREGMVKP